MPPQDDPLPSLLPLLESIRARYGPYVISPPAGSGAPVAIVLPLDVRYCAECENFKPRAQMRYLDICAACAGRPKKKKPTRRKQ